ncbi:hypothetical protein AAFF_G00313430 [Aldrovandia affinis]|uniref:Centrosomal protein of 126 kDa n=1 Tax=Aldrovandia affinis TaxID=143900 RepID=A0AAD7SQG9_9TELE|nr:hypothetical protein AAFF_G00313430 [Aldrovandia affinis]
MQVQKGSSYTNMRADLDWILEDEHDILVEEQKACRARARKFSLETNRRRRALEERRKEDDVREQKLRDEILQQRKHKVQDVTERFQRAHLPPSQRKRQASRRGTFFRSPTSNRSYTSSPSSSASSSGSRYQRQLTTAVAYAKLMQERSGGSLKSSQLLFHNELQETQRLLEERQLNSLQDFQREVGQLGQSESLSSLDSLENEVSHRQPTGSPGCTSCSSSDNSEVSNCARPQSPRKPFSDPRPTSEFTSCGSEHSGEGLHRTNTIYQPPIEEAEGPRDHDKTMQAGDLKPALTPSHQATSDGILGNVVPLTPQDRTNPLESTEPNPNGPCEKVPVAAPCKAWASPDTTPAKSSWPTEGDVPGQTRFCSHPPATQIIMPTNPGSGREVNSSATPVSQTGTDPEGSATTPPEKFSHLNKSHLTFDAKTSCDRDADPETRRAQSWPSAPSDPTSKSYHVKLSTGHEQEPLITSAVVSASSSACRPDNVKSVKGILKKDSKYVTCHAKVTFSPASPQHFAVSVKDSVELMKHRERDGESSKGVKKKLRWFDEVDYNEEDDDTRPFRDVSRQHTQGRGKPTNPLQGKAISVGLQEGPVQASASGVTRTIPPSQVVTPPTPASHHRAKQAWTDSRGPERADEGRPEMGSPRRGRTRGPRRVRSARARLGPAPPRTRKGAMVRPQSASTASQVYRAAQGRIIVPHPPPKAGSPEVKLAQGLSTTDEVVPNLNPAKSAYAEVQSYGRSRPLAEQASNGYAVLPGSSVSTAGGVAFAPFPPSYALSAYEAITKATYAMGNGQAAGQQEAVGRRGPLYVEHGLNLTQTPTDEEISQLWHGVRSALGPKDDNQAYGDPRNLVTYNSLLSGLTQARANLSHVTIDGGSLLSGIKAVTRMGGFFVTTSNLSKSPVRRKQSADSNGIKHRALLEQRRVTSGSGPRKLPIPTQTTVQISPLGSKADQISGVALQDEAQAQFLLAENLVESSTTDADILAAIETAHAQVQRPAAPMQQRPQHPGPSALSLEEQRLMLSLDRLNHRLQYVQEATAGNPSVPSVLQIVTPANLPSRPGEGQGMAKRRYRASSADNRPQRR